MEVSSGLGVNPSSRVDFSWLMWRWVVRILSDSLLNTGSFTCILLTSVDTGALMRASQMGQTKEGRLVPEYSSTRAAISVTWAQVPLRR